MRGCATGARYQAHFLATGTGASIFVSNSGAGRLRVCESHAGSPTFLISLQRYLRDQGLELAGDVFFILEHPGDPDQPAIIPEP